MEAWCPGASRRGPNATLTSLLGVPSSEQLDGSRIHIIVVSGIQFYPTRLAWGRATWAKNLAPNITLSVIGDEPGPDIPGTTCKPYTNNVCCKIANGLQDTVAKGHEDGPYDWIFVVDDDAYVNTQGLRLFLAAQWSPWVGRRIIGDPGCGNGACAGICGGGGIALSRGAAEEMVDKPGFSRYGHSVQGVNFYDEFMQQCKVCDGWGDLTISQIAERRDCTQKPASGLHPWDLSPADLKMTLENSCSTVPLSFHYLSSEAEFQHVHNYLSQHPIEDCEIMPWNAQKHEPR